MNENRVNTILLDLQCLLGLYEVNKEVYLEGLDAYLIGILICHDLGVETIAHISPDYRMIEEQAKAYEACNDFIRSLIAQLSSFTVILNLSLDTDVSMKFFINSSYGLDGSEISETVVYTVEAKVSNKDQISFRNCTEETFKSSHVQCFADMIACIPEITAKMQDLQPTNLNVEPKSVDKKTTLHKKRSWISSHHIYSSEKRKNMLALASDGSLFGFCLPGKPGVICIEGDADEVDSFWSRIRRWNWQRLQLVYSETYDCTCMKPSKSCDCAKFPPFSELILDNASSNKKQDMSEFVKYLNSYNSSDAFEKLFGFEAK